MTAVDALLVVLWIPFALRGFWRGLCREVFGLAGWLGGLFAAAASASLAAPHLVERTPVPEPVAPAVAFVAILFACVVGANLLGLVTGRLARALFLGGFNRVAGVVFGSAKGAAILGFGLLVLERLAPTSGLAEAVSTSTLGRPLTRFAAIVLDAGRGLVAQPQGEA